jgi:hypothetical protein
MSYSAYIIGEIPERITIKCRKDFENAQYILEKRGFNVINPLKNLLNKKIKSEDANKINIRQLLNCNVVYVLPTVSFEKPNNPELLLALKLNLLIIQDLVFLSEDEEIEELNSVEVL